MTYRVLSLSSFILAAACFAAGGASAHVTLEPASAPAGSYQKLSFRVPHGCSGKPTTGITVQMPDGIVSAKPQAKPGWALSVDSKPLAKPVSTGHGATATEAVRAVSWKGGNLPNDQFEEFSLLVQVPEKPGETLAFPVVQNCGEAEMRWEQIALPGQNAHSLKAPAPLLLVADGMPGMAKPVANAGPVQILAPFARPTPAKVGGIFLTLKNTGGADDKLIRAASPAAENVELHTNVKDGDAMRMRPVDSIPLAANGETKLEPGGYHVMLIGLKQPLKTGDKVPLTLTFEKAGSVTLQVPVAAAPPGSNEGGMGHMHH